MNNCLNDDRATVDEVTNGRRKQELGDELQSHGSICRKTEWRLKRNGCSKRERDGDDKIVRDMRLVWWLKVVRATIRNWLYRNVFTSCTLHIDSLFRCILTVTMQLQVDTTRKTVRWSSQYMFTMQMRLRIVSAWISRTTARCYIWFKVRDRRYCVRSKRCEPLRKQTWQHTLVGRKRSYLQIFEGNFESEIAL